MPTFLLSMFSGVFGAIGAYFVEKQKQRGREIEMQNQIQMQQMKMESEAVKADGVAANTRLKSTGRAFKYFTFFMWFTPFILGIIHPTAAEVIFVNFNLMPGWYSQACVLMMFAVWGISVSAPVVNGIFSNLGQYIANGKQAKYDHQQTMATINREAIFASLRESQGALSQRTVDEVNQALNAGDSDPTNDGTTRSY